LRQRFCIGKNTILQRYDDTWICVSKAKSFALLFEGDADLKRFNKNNFYLIFTIILKKGDVVIDVGASYGDEVIDIAKLVDEEGKVYSFEPDRDDFEALKQTIHLNNLKM